MEFVIVLGIQRWLLLSFQKLWLCACYKAVWWDAVEPSKADWYRSMEYCTWQRERGSVQQRDWVISAAVAVFTSALTCVRWTLPCVGLSLTVLRAALRSAGLSLQQGNASGGKWLVLSLGITLSFIVTSRVGNLGIFSVSGNISEKASWIQEAWSL